MEGIQVIKMKVGVVLRVGKIDFLFTSKEFFIENFDIFVKHKIKQKMTFCEWVKLFDLKKKCLEAFD